MKVSSSLMDPRVRPVMERGAASQSKHDRAPDAQASAVQPHLATVHTRRGRNLSTEMSLYACRTGNDKVDSLSVYN